MRQAPSDTLEGRAWLQQKPSPVPQIEVPEGLKLETAQENNRILWFCLFAYFSSSQRRLGANRGSNVMKH